MTVVDVHNHFFPAELPDLAARFGGEWPAVERTGQDTARVHLGGRPFRDIDARCWDVGLRIADMDRDGIAVQAISATPVLFAYQHDGRAALELARRMNDLALALAGTSGGRIVTLAQVPLQDVALAVTEVERAMKDGHRGVEIGNHVGARDLDDAGLVDFLQACADLGAAVLVHPWDMMGAERTRRYMMAWTVGMPAETQLAITAMILGGAFDRLPRALRLCFAHGGGSFAFLLGRLANAWANKDTARGVSQHPPAHYLDRFMVDSAVFDERALGLLVEVIGEDRVVLGSDYPFPLGEQQAGALVRNASALDATQKRKILSDNPRRFLGLA